MAVVSGNSLLAQTSLVLCFINSGVRTAFQFDPYGDVVFEDPVGTGELDYATEGRNGFCCISFRYLNLLCTQLVFIQSHLLNWYFIFSWLAFPPWVAWLLKYLAELFQVFFVVIGCKK